MIFVTREEAAKNSRAHKIIAAGGIVALAATMAVQCSASKDGNEVAAAVKGAVDKLPISQTENADALVSAKKAATLDTLACYRIAKDVNPNHYKDAQAFGETLENAEAAALKRAQKSKTADDMYGYMLTRGYRESYEALSSSSAKKSFMRSLHKKATAVEKETTKEAETLSVGDTVIVDKLFKDQGR